MEIFKAKLTHEQFNTSKDSTVIRKDSHVYLTVFKHSNGMIGVQVNGFSQEIMANVKDQESSKFKYLYNNYLKHFDSETLKNILKK